MNKDILLSDMLRPTKFSELALSAETAGRFQQMMDAGNVMNLLLWGSPGTGKTTTAMIFDNGNFDVLFVNGSLQTGIDVIRDEVARFAYCSSLYDCHKLVIIDEADFLSESAQASLRALIEQVSKNCRFIFTANDPQRLSAAIRSRLLGVHFAIDASEKPEIIERLTTTISAKLLSAGISVEPDSVRAIINKHYPDLRTVANNLQLQFG